MELVLVKRTHPLLVANMQGHYSSPKGFVGRNICYIVIHEGVEYGSIVGGSATLHLAGRENFLPFHIPLTEICNNIFFHIEPQGGYPIRNFGQRVLALWRERVAIDWHEKYGDQVRVFESLVELPRTGEVYRRDKWAEVGMTKGYTCKREAGKGTDSWSGRRVWNTKDLRPKRVFMRMA